MSKSVHVGIVTSVALSVFLGASQTNSDRPRETAEKIAELLAALEATPGKVIADVGAGEGFYTIRIAQAVAPNGRVTAVDQIRRSRYASRKTQRREDCQR